MTHTQQTLITTQADARSCASAPLADTDWANLNLPNGWPDQISNPLLRLMKVLHAMTRGRVRSVQIPEGMPGQGRLPKYLFQEFHHLPNGNYSKTITRGYAQGFNRAMLGELDSARAEIAKRLGGRPRILDIGCGAGHLTGALQRANIGEVWALDPSPYLLQHAARQFPGAHYVQGVIEDSGLPESSFDGAGACFVFHEIPPRQADAALRELWRILKPGARLILIEPSAIQATMTYPQLWRRYGLRGLYFRALAMRTHEPFVNEWRNKNMAAWFPKHGFTLIDDRDQMPWRLLEARRSES